MFDVLSHFPRGLFAFVAVLIERVLDWALVQALVKALQRPVKALECLVNAFQLSSVSLSLDD